MLYLKADGSTVLKYPYTFTDLQADNPHTSFPVPTPEEIYTDFGASVVEETPVPEYDPITQNLSELEPTYSMGEWSQTWLVSAATAEEIEARTQMRYEQTRSELAVYYDAQARLGGFADRNACVARAGYAGTYQVNGQVFGAWMDECNAIAGALPQPFPPTEEIIALFPALAWPFSNVPFAP
jgi:hypothetical protein